MNDLESRQRIRSAFTEALFVEAGAGTGKTTELVARVVGLVCEGRARIEQIVAITFTEAAAGELRTRLTTALDEAVCSRDRSSVEHQRAATAIDSIEDAPIETIHAFAMRLLQLHPTEAGLPPVFEVRDDVASRLAFDTSWMSFLRSTLLSAAPLEDHLDEILRTALSLGAEVRHLESMARTMDGQWHRVANWLRGVDAHERRPSVDIRPLADMLAEVGTRVEHCLDLNDPMAIRIIKEIVPWRARLIEAAKIGNEYSLLAVLSAPPRFTTRIGARSRWQPGVLDDTRRQIDSVAGIYRETFEPVRLWTLRMLGSIVGRHVCAAANERHRRGELGFHDLLVLARNMLYDAGVRSSVRSLFSYILVDEFQDTDPLQAELIELLSCGEGDGDVSVFTVGDPKQSIYRFRNADIDQYLAFREKSHVQIVSLDTNFRSLDGVLRWINSTFELLLDDVVRGQWKNLEPGREVCDPADLGGVEIIGQALDRKTRASRIRQIEADEIATSISSRVRQSDDVRGSRRGEDVNFRDVAVLMPTRSSLPALERALQGMAIPYRVESRSLIWATQEIRDLIVILRAIDDPRDAKAVVATLRTPAFACGDDDLLAWRTRGGEWDYRDQNKDVAAPAVSRAFAGLRSFHDVRLCMSVSELVGKVVRDTFLFEIAYARERRRETWNRLRFFIDCARRFTEEGNGGLHSFMTWLDGQIEQGADVLESAVPEQDDDAVRVMTIHASKGLEFPITYLCGLGAGRTRFDSVRVLWGDDDSLEMRIGPAAQGWQTSEFTKLEQQDAEKESKEQARLLYVGATRARNHLVVGVYHQEEKTPRSLAARLLRVRRLLSSSDADPAANVLRERSEQGFVHLREVLKASVAPEEAIDMSRTESTSSDEGSRDDVSIDYRANQHLVHAAAIKEGSRTAAVRRGSRSVALSATAVMRRMSADAAVSPAAVIPDEADREHGIWFHRALEQGLDYARPAAALQSLGSNPVFPKSSSPSRTAWDPSIDMPESLDPNFERLAIGRAVHRLLEAVPLDDSIETCRQWVRSRVQDISKDEGVGHRSADIELAVLGALGSEVLTEARRNRFWREMFVAADVGGTVIEGYVDLVYELPEGFVVIDYKTDLLGGDHDVETFELRYRWQLATYAVALESATGKKVVRAALLSVPSTGSACRAVWIDIQESCAELRTALFDDTSADDAQRR